MDINGNALPSAKFFCKSIPSSLFFFKKEAFAYFKAFSHSRFGELINITKLHEMPHTSIPVSCFS